jgi:hypothetical protein
MINWLLFIKKGGYFTMKIIKTSKADGSTKEISLAECLEYTEGTDGYGYWKKGTVEQMLKDGIEVFTPFATYKMV